MTDLALSREPLHLLLLGPFGAPLAWDAPVPAEPAPPPPEVEATPAASSSDGPQVPKRSSRPAPAAEDAAELASALGAWCSIIERMKTAFDVYGQLKGLITEEAIGRYFVKKKAGTLMVRATAWRLFLKFAEDFSHDPQTLDEAQAYAYLNHLVATGAPPSRGDSFIRAVNFAHGHCGFKKAFEISSSARCLGAAAVSLAEKRLRVQRDPLLVAWVISAEEAVVAARDGGGPLTMYEACTLGFLLFCVHTRSRCADAARISREPTLDEAVGKNASLFSFIEASTAGHATKTGNTSRLANLCLPVAGLSRGIADVPWASCWLALRRILSLDATEDGCLMRVPLLDGSFAEGRIRAGQATTWLRCILLKLGARPEEIRNVGSHSCKATLLSLAAKGGLLRDDRRILGGHAFPGDKSVDTYSRDALAAPLFELAQLLVHVREGTFKPDSSRSGRWTSLPGDHAGTLSDCASCNEPIFRSHVFVCDCAAIIHARDDCRRTCPTCSAEFGLSCDCIDGHICCHPAAQAPCRAFESDALTGSEDDSDGDIAIMAVEEADEEILLDESRIRFIEKGFAFGDDAKLPTLGVFVNKRSKCAHKAVADWKSACGIDLSPLSYQHRLYPGALDGTKLCFRAGCNCWEKKDESEEEFLWPDEDDAENALDEAMWASPAPTP